MLQTLYFKFSASEESVYIFSTLHMEPWGRISIGVMELVASVLLFVPSLAWLGGLLGVQLMAGAVFFHLTILGIPVLGDNGYLFSLALLVLLCCALVAWLQKHEIVKQLLALKSKLYKTSV